MSDYCQVCGSLTATEFDFPMESPTYDPLPYIQELLSSNNPPSQLQESQIEATVAEIYESLQGLDARIFDMQRILKELCQERARKTAELRDCKSILHPIRRLPNDILCEIFLSSIKGEQVEDQETTLDPSLMHWVLPRVCSQWRSVGLSFPRLWSTVRVSPDDLDFDTMGPRRTCFILGTQLHRSGSHPLSVAISSDTEIPKFHPILEILFLTSSRWEELSVLVPTKAHTAFAPLKGSLQALKTLELWVHNQESPPLQVEAGEMYELAPKLTNFVGSAFLAIKLVFPFSQITSYNSITPATCCATLHLVSRFPNLEVLRVVCFIDNAHDISRGWHEHVLPAIVTLPLLRKFVCIRGPTDAHDEWEDDQHSSDDCLLLSQLSLPALNDLDIVVHKSTDQLEALLRRSQCPLKTLSLETHDISADDLINMLRAIPTLQSLTLDCEEESVIQTFMEELIQNSSILPHLQRLELAHNWNIDPVQLAQLKASRPLLSMLEISGTRY
ncbi:hypothetical protein C8J56DRAFT_585009 [Mycena floridula]|nr:hypothetical protein C8J56DRAFT_585009 [Mycena floridula]